MGIQFLQHHNLLSSSTTSTSTYCSPLRTQFLHQLHIFIMASTNYKEAFALFDKRGNQRVQVESLGDLLRACGQNPTLSEIRDLERMLVVILTSRPSPRCSTA